MDTILPTNKRKVGVLGLSFKEGTDDLRESSMVQLAKRMIGEGCRMEIWDKNVVLGRLIGSNRKFIQETIPHIGGLLTDNLGEIIADAEVVVISTKAVEKEALLGKAAPDQIVVDVVNLGKPAEQPVEQAW